MRSSYFGINLNLLKIAPPFQSTNLGLFQLTTKALTYNKEKTSHKLKKCKMLIQYTDT